MTQTKTVVRALSEDPAAAPLIITRLEAIPIAIPLGKPVTMAGVRIEKACNLLVRA